MNLAMLSREAMVKAPRICLIGVEKVGKTTFACGSRVENGKVVEYGLNKPVVISIRGEEGADAIPVAKFPVAETFDDVLDAVGALYDEDNDFQTVVVDSVSTLYYRVKDAIMADPENKMPTKLEYDRFNRGPLLAVEHFERLLSGLTSLREKKNMASILIGHVKTKTISSPDTDPYDAWVWDVPDVISNLLFRWSDLILMAKTPDPITKADDARSHKRAIEKSSAQRILCTQKSAKQPGGGRGIYGMLPPELPLDWASFTEAVKSIKQ